MNTSPRVLPSPRSRAIEAACNETIQELSLLFTIKDGVASIPETTPLPTLLHQCYKTPLASFTLNDPEEILTKQEALPQILSATFDADARGFLNDASGEMLAHLAKPARACLLAQAIAGMVLVFKRLAECDCDISPPVLRRELQFFAESEERRLAIDRLERSGGFTRAYSNGQVAFLIAEAIRDEGLAARAKGLGVYDVDMDYLPYSAAHVPRDMGLPGGFSILMLN